MSAEDGAGKADPRVGLCSLCRHVRVQRSARGSIFYRCARAASDPRFRPYPPLPVRECPGFEPPAGRARS